MAFRYFVIPVLAGGQVLPGHPVLGRWQVIYVRIVTPARDGFSLLHWTQPSHTLQAFFPRAGTRKNSRVGFYESPVHVMDFMFVYTNKKERKQHQRFWCKLKLKAFITSTF